MKEALVTLEKGYTCNLWILESCPYCGDRHIHGAGRPDKNPRTLLSHRVSHCLGKQDVNQEGYILVEAQ